MNRIKALREDRDLRQIDVSKATGIDQRTLSNYETEKTYPDSYAIIKLAEFFGVTTDYLLGVTDYDFTSYKSIIDEISDIEMKLNNIKKFLEIISNR